MLQCLHANVPVALACANPHHIESRFLVRVLHPNNFSGDADLLGQLI